MFGRWFEIIGFSVTVCRLLVAANEVCMDFQDVLELNAYLTMAYVVKLEDKATGQGTVMV